MNPGGGKKADNLFRPPPRPKRPMPPKGIIGEDFICVPEEGGGFTLISKKDEGEENARDPSKPAVRSSSGAEKSRVYYFQPACNMQENQNHHGKMMEER